MARLVYHRDCYKSELIPVYEGWCPFLKREFWINILRHVYQPPKSMIQWLSRPNVQIAPPSCLSSVPDRILRTRQALQAGRVSEEESIPLAGTAMKTWVNANSEGTTIEEITIVLYAFNWVHSLGDCTDSMYAAFFPGEYTWALPVVIALQRSERSVLRLPSQIPNDIRRIPSFPSNTLQWRHQEISERWDREGGMSWR